MSSSIIPKINLGLKNKRNKFNLSQDTNTTANFGFCQPTFCREMMPNSTFNMNGVQSFVRLSPVTVPTFGRISYRTYHSFVPYSSLYFPFDSFLSGTAYTNTSGQTFEVNRLHTFTFRDLIKDLITVETKAIQYFEVFTAYSASEFESHKNDFVIADPKGIMNYDNQTVDQYSCDFYINNKVDGSKPIFVKFTAKFCNLYKIFVGLGYNFAPHSIAQLNILKLLAYYKAWFNYMYPQREINFFHTNCYKLIVKLSNENGQDYFSWDSSTVNLFHSFLADLAECYYYLPADYFSMSSISPNIVNSISSLNSNYDLEDIVSSTVDNYYSESLDANASISQKIASVLMRFANKNTIFGKSLRDYLQNTFGVTDPHDNIHEEVVKIGASSTNITISDVMSTADTFNIGDTNTGSVIGEYAGKGIGYDKSEGYSYTAKQFGVWISFSCIVPEGGYVQGYQRENINVDRFDFATPEFDALGYQLLHRGELIHDNNQITVSDFDPTNGWGLVPRYSNYKVGKNILNGDLFRKATRLTYDCYCLDRLFEQNNISITPSNHSNFRRVGLNPLFGNYDRIFDDTDSTHDHFIIHMIFDCQALLPLKSLSSSFDTFDEESDNTTMSVNKQ